MAIGLFLAISAVSTAQVNQPIPAQVKLQKISTVTKGTNHLPMSPLVISPSAQGYSNVTTFTGYATGTGTGDATVPFNVASASIAGNGRHTGLMIDHLALTGSTPFQIDSIKVAIVNLNAANVTCTIELDFYQNTSSKPGAWINGFYTSSAVTIPNGLYIVTFILASSWSLNTTDIWAGLSYYANGGTQASLAELNNMGAGFYNPVNLGTSADNLFVSTVAALGNVSTPAGTVYSSPFSSFSAIANMGWEFVKLVPLPISIEYLHGARAGNNDNLSWKVNAVNTSVVNMSLERSTDNRNFSNVYTTSATAAQCQSAFNFTDAAAAPGVNFYRLKVTDADGKISYSQIVPLLNRATGFEIISIQPNPAVTSNATLNVTSAQPDQLQIAIYDMAGKKVATQSQQLIAGSNQVILNVSKLAAGAYQVTGVNSAGESKTIKLLKN
jgi:hypothetical protein